MTTVPPRSSTSSRLTPDMSSSPSPRVPSSFSSSQITPEMLPGFTAPMALSVRSVSVCQAHTSDCSPSVPKASPSSGQLKM